MRRPHILAAFGCLVSLAFLTVFWRSSFSETRVYPKILRLLNSEIGSDWIQSSNVTEDKVIVIAKMTDENVDWVYNDLKDWQSAIYHMDEPEYILHPPRNVGREAMAYLTFLIDHYHNLPEIIVFLHPHLEGWPQAWHTDADGYSNVLSVRSLRLDYVRANGYANMRCNGDPGCPAEIQPFRGDPSRTSEVAFAEAFTLFFGGNLSSVPEEVGTACCAQFAISRDQALARSQLDYIRYRKWLLETEWDSDVSGRVMEYMWHIIFGRDPVYCPDMNICWCEQFGRCW